MKSILVKKTAEMLNEPIAKLGHLTQSHFFLIFIALKDDMSINNYRLLVDYEKDPKQIVVVPYDIDGCVVFLKPKSKSFNVLAKEFSNMGYILRFIQRDEKHLV